LTLGIPGDVMMALMLAALTIQGIQPGPQVMTSNPELFWGLIVSFWIGNLFLVVLNIPLIGIWVRLLSIPYPLLYPAIVLFTCIGVYSTNNNVFDVYALLAFGFIGYMLLLLRFEVVPIIMGLILGPMLEENFRRTLLLSRGDFAVFFQRPISATALAVCAVLVIWSIRSYMRGKGGVPKVEDLLKRDLPSAHARNIS
jgi:putative tricarboxylic transport membrane protein